jgi:hypothetical protein
MLLDAMASMSRRDAVQAVAEMSGQSRRMIYARALMLDDGAPDASDAEQKQEQENAPSKTETES